MNSLARIHVWWPGVDKDIEEMVNGCEACQEVWNTPSATVSHPWTWPDQHIHIDFAGPSKEPCSLWWWIPTQNGLR